MTCHYLTTRSIGADARGRRVLAYGYTCGQPVTADGACTDHLAAATGLTPWPLLPLCE